MSQHPTQAFSEHTEMKRDLGLLEAVSIVISRIIGSGIFAVPPSIARSLDAFGDAVIDHYYRAAMWEQEASDSHVTNWEIARGFERA